VQRAGGPSNEQDWVMSYGQRAEGLGNEQRTRQQAGGLGPGKGGLGQEHEDWAKEQEN
jgi:hypothetical protein